MVLTFTLGAQSEIEGVNSNLRRGPELLTHRCRTDAGTAGMWHWPLATDLRNIGWQPMPLLTSALC